MKLYSSILVITFMIGLGTSCQKNTDCKLVVTTVDSVGNILAAASVKLYATVKTPAGTPVEADIKAEGISAANGTSSYTFKLPAILDVKAEYSGRKGIGIIKLEEGKTVEKKITVK